MITGGQIAQSEREGASILDGIQVTGASVREDGERTLRRVEKARQHIAHAESDDIQRSLVCHADGITDGLTDIGVALVGGLDDPQGPLGEQGNIETQRRHIRQGHRPGNQRTGGRVDEGQSIL